MRKINDGLTRQQRYQHRRRLERRCIACRNKLDTRSKSLCVVCLVKNRLRNRVKYMCGPRTATGRGRPQLCSDMDAFRALEENDL